VSARGTRLAVVLALALAAGAGGQTPPAGDAAAGAPAGHPVVVELFTSQGCSTCPPADELLSTLSERASGQVIALAFHVDSWNHDGWTDPFSSAEWTRRHAFYARKLGAKGAYTPQAVVDGAAELLGSDRQALSMAIATAARRPAASLRVEVGTPDTERVLVKVEGTLPEELREARLELMLAVVETGLVTPVKRGENGGRTLENDHVVRSFEKSARVAADSAGGFRHETSLKLGPGWERSKLTIVAFVQEARSLAIRGADAEKLPAS